MTTATEKETKNLYEGMYILNAGLSEEARGRALKKIEDLIVEFGGEVKKVHDRGRQRLSYEIRNHREGYYYLIYFEVTPTAIKPMHREYHLMEDLLRFITLRADEVLEEIKFKSLAEQ